VLGGESNASEIFLQRSQRTENLCYPFIRALKERSPRSAACNLARYVPAHDEFRTVAHQYRITASPQGANFANVVQVHNSRAMDAHETVRIELFRGVVSAVFALSCPWAYPIDTQRSSNRPELR
jgi:hypothetical protein